MADIAEQPLPRTFEEFNEQRRASFIRVKDYKQAGNRLVGYLCSYTPLEIIDAAGAAGVALCGTSDEVIPEAEKVLPANLCPLIKSTYGFAYSQKCPFTYFSDLIIGETTCDGKKKMYELLSELKPVHILRLPQGRDRAWERQGWREECRLLKERLEQLYGITITDDDLRAAARRRNCLRAAFSAQATASRTSRARWSRRWPSAVRPMRRASAPSPRAPSASSSRAAPWVASSTRSGAPSSATCHWGRVPWHAFARSHAIGDGFP